MLTVQEQMAEREKVLMLHLRSQIGSGFPLCNVVGPVQGPAV